jgi:hypothetical protein
MQSDTIPNPFSVQTPEDIIASDALKLFVNVFTDFHKIRDAGHSMLNGPRGCGKSMMFRYLMPDCQRLDRKCGLSELPFFAVLVSIKNTDLNLTELQRLKRRQANIVLNEHFLTMYVASRLFMTAAREAGENSEQSKKEVHNYFHEVFIPRLRLCGWSGNVPALATTAAPSEVFTCIRKLCDELYSGVISYVRQLSFEETPVSSYRGPLCGYLDFLQPLCDELRALSFMPKGPIYLLVDDADYLNSVQTMVLNSWVATRTSATISIKVSTQLKYKTFRTPSGMLIDSPHDFAEVNISDIYTTTRGKYLNRVEEIVKKRLAHSGINSSPQDFFPVDQEQEDEIAQIAEKLKADWAESGRGNRASDDVLRYSRPIFIAGLKGQRKSGSTYSYAGFEQLVHISSGLIRYFLEPAALMFSEQQAQSADLPITCITPRIQNDIIRAESDRLMLAEFEKMFKEEHEQDAEAATRIGLLERKLQLQNLIRALGGTFHQKLISEDSERRVFSVAFSGPADPEVTAIFELGVQFGYFHRSTIGNKDGTGRTALYVLTRRLAPHFNLDPTGFAGYLFVTSEKMREAIQNPDKFLRKVKERGVKDSFEERQLPLFG